MAEVDLNCRSLTKRPVLTCQSYTGVFMVLGNLIFGISYLAGYVGLNHV